MINFLLLGELICLGETFVFFDLNEYKLTIPQKCTDIVMKQIFHELDMKKKKHRSNFNYKARRNIRDYRRERKQIFTLI